MKRKARLPHLFATTLEDVRIDRPRTTKIFGIDCSVGIEHLAKAHHDLLAGFSFHLQADPAGEILPQIKDMGTRRGFGQFHGRQLLRSANRNTGVGLDKRLCV